MSTVYMSNKFRLLEMFDLGLIVSYNVVEKATAYCIAIPVGARIACPRFVQMNPPRAAAAGKRRRCERAENQSGNKNQSENKTKKPCKANLAGLIWWSVLDSNRLPTA